MKRLAFLLLALLPCTAQAANIPGQGSCGPRGHVLEWMAQSDARTPGYSIVDVRDPRTGEVIGQVEMSFWANPDGQTAVVLFQMVNDPQHGAMAFGCVVHRGDGQQPDPIFVPKRGA